MASLPEDLRGRLTDARFVKTEEEKDGKGAVRKTTWKLKAENGKTLARLKFSRTGKGWTVEAEGPLAEELVKRFGEEYRQWLEKAPAEMSAGARLAHLLGLLATDLHLNAERGKASQIGLGTTAGWLFAAAAALLGEKKPRTVVYVMLEGIRVAA